MCLGRKVIVVTSRLAATAKVKDWVWSSGRDVGTFSVWRAHVGYPGTAQQQLVTKQLVNYEYYIGSEWRCQLCY